MAENTVPIFNGGNYDSWCIKMRAYLLSQDMWDLVENGYDHLKKKMRMKDGEALLKILNAIPELIVPSLKNAETSKEAWTILHQKYGRDKKGRKRCQTQRRKLKLTVEKDINAGASKENVLGTLSKQSSGNHYTPKRQHKESGGDIRDNINAVEEVDEESSEKAEKRRRISNPEDLSNVLESKENVLRLLSRQSSGNQNVSRDIRDNANIGEEVEASTPSPSSPITSTGSEFEVFLSFRGEDTRKGFTGHLYEGLKQCGISTFKDDVNLDKGKEIDQLLEYIEKSKIFVPIFSKNYADSKWCLKEVTKSVECGKEIVPVFFGVEPSDVRKQRGSFKAVFQKHESDKAQNQEEVKKWKEALKIVGNLSGFTLKEKNGDEVELKHAIIKRVLNIVNKKPLQVAKHPIGVETCVEDVKRMLENIRGKGVGMIGIHGMGGLGKTTIAKAVYNDMAPHGFDGATCFLFDIREQSGRPNGLIKLQKQFLGEVFREKDVFISGVAHGQSLIKDKASRKKVLLILDDVDSEEQINALAGGRDWFGLGSVIIITTRDKQVLVAHGVKDEEIYEPQGLNEAQSLELFIRHAFHSKQPQGEYVRLAKQVVKATGGLPLTLKVLGSLWSSITNAREWKDTLEKLKKIPPEEVQKILKISYDSLDDNEKQIFLDISCFFIGQNKQNATYMWEGCGWYPTAAIGKLERRSLIKINKNSGEFEMHDQIRDMGREIVAEKSSRQLEKQSRIWNPKDSLDLLRRRVGTKDVEAIYLDHYMDPAFVADCESFTAMSQLRMLRMLWVTLEGDYKHFPKELKWLQCSLKKLDSLPTSLHLENIVLLDLSYSDIVQFWDVPKVNLNMCLSLGSGDSKSWKMPVLGKVRVLKLEGCYNLIMCPDFRSMPKLQILDCGGCTKMSELHPSIGHLQSLINLNLEACRSLKQLPKEVWQLTSLEELNLGHCNKITALPSTIEDCMSSKQSMPEKIKFLTLDWCRSLITCPNFMSMPRLEKLKLLGCGEIKEVDPSISHLKSLIELDLSWCGSLKELPQEIGQLTSLQQLDISHCSQISTLPESMGQLNQLKSLNLDGCSSLQSLPPLPPSLISLSAYHCNKLESIADVSNAKGLQQLNLYRCERLVDIPGIEQLKCLEELLLEGCSSLCDSIPERIKGLDGLTKLGLSGCIQMTEVDPSISQLTSLESLDLSYCCQITALTNSMISLENLLHLSVNHCNDLKFLPELPPKLTTFYATYCTELERIEGVSFPEGLKNLDLTRCGKLVDIPDIVQFEGLQYLKLGGCRSLQNSFLERVELSISHLDLYYRNSYSIPGKVIKGGSSDPQSFSFLIPEWLRDEDYLLLEVDESSFKRIRLEVEQRSNGCELEDESNGSSEADERSNGSELEDESMGSSDEDRNLGLEVADERSNIPNDDEVRSPIESQQGRSAVRLLFSTADDAQIPFSAFFEYWDCEISDNRIPTAIVGVRRGELSSPSKMIEMHVSIDGCVILHADFFTKIDHKEDYVRDHNIVKVSIIYDRH